MSDRGKRQPQQAHALQTDDTFWFTASWSHTALHADVRLVRFGSVLVAFLLRRKPFGTEITRERSVATVGVAHMTTESGLCHKPFRTHAAAVRWIHVVLRVCLHLLHRRKLPRTHLTCEYGLNRAAVKLKEV